MASKEYRLIQEETGPDEIFTHYHDNVPSLSKKRRLITYILCITLALSLAANALLTLHSLRRPHDLPPNKTAFGSVTLSLCTVQSTDDQQPASSATRQSHGPITAPSPTTTEAHGTKPGRP